MSDLFLTDTKQIVTKNNYVCTVFHARILSSSWVGHNKFHLTYQPTKSRLALYSSPLTACNLNFYAVFEK